MQALESYRRARLIDAVTSDDGKIAPLYKLDEICELLRSSPPDGVKYIVEYIIIRLDSKAPCIKQKALRLIKYASQKGGKEFKKQIQQQSSKLKTLLHFRGEVDPLKGDAPNKAVRDAAQEALSAVYAEEEGRGGGAGGVGQNGKGRRMEGFGNKVDERAKEGSKGDASLSSFVELGTESWKQGLRVIETAAGALSTSYGGSSNRTRFLTGDEQLGSEGSYEGPHSVPEFHVEQGKYRSSAGYGREAANGWERESHGWEGRRGDVNGAGSGVDDGSEKEGVWGRAERGGREVKSEEARIVDEITTPAGIRLQPTREALLAFIAQMSKMNAPLLAQLLEEKLLSQVWQVRLRGLCVLEAVLRHEKDENCEVIFGYFVDNPSSVYESLESPQMSLKEKSKRVLDLMGLHHSQLNPSSSSSSSSAPATSKTSGPSLLPDLISDFNDDAPRSSAQPQAQQLPDSSLGDLLGEDLVISADVSTSNSDLLSDDRGHVAEAMGELKAAGQDGEGSGLSLFSGLEVSEHAATDGSSGEMSGLFSGLTVDESKPSNPNEAKPNAAVNVNHILSGYTSSHPLAWQGTVYPGMMPVQGLPGVMNQGVMSQGVMSQGVMSQGVMSQGVMSQGVMNQGLMSQGMQVPPIPPMLMQQQLLFMQAMGLAMPPNVPPLSAAATSIPVFSTLNLPNAATHLTPSHPDAAAGPLGTAGKRPLDEFDFSGNPAVVTTVKSPQRMEEVQAFDFVQDHMHSLGSRQSYRK